MALDTHTCPTCNGSGRVRPDRPVPRRGAPICPWGRKVSKSGSVTRNRRHVCSEVCEWTGQQCLDWLAETPYTLPDGTKRLPILTGCASCLCGLSANYHVGSVANPDGSLKGRRAVDCEYRDREPVTRDL